MNEKQKLFTRHSIGTRIAALFMLLILVITGVMTYVSISVSTSELLDSSTDYTEQLILRVNAELDMYVEYMKDISDFIVDNGAVAAYLQAANEHRLTDAACRGAQQQLAAAQKIRAEITSIALIPQSGGALFGSEGASLNTYSNYHTADWYVDALADPDEVQVSSSRVENLIAGQYNWVVSFSKAVRETCRVFCSSTSTTRSSTGSVRISSWAAGAISTSSTSRAASSGIRSRISSTRG